MQKTLSQRLLPNYPCDRSNRLQVMLSQEDFTFLYELFPELGFGSCLATAFVAKFLADIRESGIKDYSDRIRSNTYANLNTIITDVVGYQPTPAAHTEPDKRGAKRVPRA